MVQEVKIDKLVHGGQGMGQLADGRKVFVWNAYPGETVLARITKKRRDYAEAIAEQVIQESKERIKPTDEAFLSTSPWQTLSWTAENKYKKEILEETFKREGISVPVNNFVYSSEGATGASHYRNKMEYSFWGDDAGLHLALYHRGSHGKRIVQGSSIARSEVDGTANKICAILNQHKIRASQLKTVVVRCNQAGNTVAALFVKDEDFPNLPSLQDVCRGAAVYFSNPKSPASIITKQLQLYGDTSLHDAILGHEIAYDVNSFFQVNLPIFEKALKDIKQALTNCSDVIDMYSGVGAIGVPISAKVLVELDEGNVKMAQKNIKKGMRVIQAGIEQALEYIISDSAMVFDPPRAGLHPKVIERVLEVCPPKIAYLSCNPATQARDIRLLADKFKITTITGYNFFPRTPHIESLAILEPR